jgi:anti-sigma regulatory factor (Ser/Thr protein kinase)
MPEIVTLALPGVPSEVAFVRACARYRLRGSPRLDDAVTILSELTTNAVRHSVAREDGGSFEVVFELEAGHVRLEVVDGGAAEPMRVSPQEADEYGRGWEIVAALADKWGHEKVDGRSTYWAELYWAEPTDA